MTPSELFDGGCEIQAPLSLPALMAIPNHRGVFFLEGPAGESILLATGASIRTRMRTKLTAPAGDVLPSRRADLRTVARVLRWKLSDSRFETDWHFWQLARAIYPKTYRELLNFEMAWFLHMDIDAPAPWVARTQNVLAERGRYFGPFVTGRSAQRFLETLQDAFDLCRCLDELRAAPRGQACVYRQMGRCRGPCQGGISMDDYRQIVRLACDFAAGDHASVKVQLQQEMKALAGRQLYEQAANCKARLKRLEELEKPEYAYVAPAEAFAYLLLHMGAKRTIKTFFVDRGTIAPGPTLKYPLVEEQVGQVLPALREFLQQDHPVGLAQREAIGLVSHYFFFPDERTGVPLRCTERLTTADLAEAIERNVEPLKLSKPEKPPRPPGPPGPGEPPPVSDEPAGPDELSPGDAAPDDEPPQGK